MTISYTKEVATSSFSCFLKLLARWRGSIYKLLWKDFIVFAGIYYILSFIYRFALNEEQRKIFEMVARYCEANNALIPVAFILGFYVTLIMTRWWNQLGHIPWPDHMAMYVTANVQGLDERGRMMRRTMLRYIMLAFTITMTCISPAARKRFPTNNHIVKAGIMTENEKEILERIDAKYGNFFIPLAWTTSLVARARKEGRIKDDFAVKTLNDEINEFRRHLATLFVYDWITVPLVYTQVVTVAVYMFFLACLMGRQFTKNNPDMPDMYFPLFTFLEYFFYMGWLKVAECLVNPFGEDEEDFDVNFLIDRNLHVAYTIVDGVHNEHPELIKDQYWDHTKFEMPYTLASEHFRIKQPHLGSAVDLTVSVKEREFAMPSSAMEAIDEDQDNFDGFDPCSPSDYHQEREGFSLLGGRKTKHLALRRLFSKASVPSRPPRLSTGLEETPTPKQGALVEPISPVTPVSLSQLQFEYESDNPDFDAKDEGRAENILMQNLGQPHFRSELSTSPKTLTPSSEKISITPEKSSAKFINTFPESSIVDETKSPRINDNSAEIFAKPKMLPELVPVSQSEAPTESFQSPAPMPETPISPDPVWVLASSQWRLSQAGVPEKSNNVEERV